MIILQKLPNVIIHWQYNSSQAQFGSSFQLEISSFFLDAQIASGYANETQQVLATRTRVYTVLIALEGLGLYNAAREALLRLYDYGLYKSNLPWNRAVGNMVVTPCGAWMNSPFMELRMSLSWAKLLSRGSCSSSWPQSRKGHTVCTAIREHEDIRGQAVQIQRSCFA